MSAFVIKSIVRSKKTNRTINKLFFIVGAPLRHVDDAPRHNLAHSAGIGWPGALASGLKEPVPGLFESRREHGNRFRIEGYFRPNQINNAGIRVLLLRQSCRPAPLGSRRGWLR